MPVESDDDRLAVLLDFGITADFSGTPVTAIFDDGYEDTLGTWVTIPVLTVRDIDISTSSRGDTVIISSVTYSIADIQPDGQGISTVILQRS